VTENALRATPETIRTLRARRGWTVDELARRLGMQDAESIVSDWEEGRRRVEGPIADLLLSTLRNGTEDPALGSGGEAAHRFYARTV